ncbi:VOC family protein [Vibrio spartinae]|uniref:Glyoxalase-like domain protein n=1 Tax=Vibrio spartinae TaxID=1918945 RepID=A0A1N6M9S9_9VIBR|nr:VOC family protein [Vibrio spartinae]QMV15955.1 Glyoxalase-like domain protein [Vibrio spartinae]SIO96209.1 Glyoxalase-like domain protein [Vibrio spartinae]
MSVLRSTVVFYVADIEKSQVFYSALFGCHPVQASGEFVLYLVHDGLTFGIWKQSAVIPTITPGSALPSKNQGELCLFVEDQDAFQQMHQHCLLNEFPILQEPAVMDFATAFTVTDPDGHRIRYAVGK